MKKIPDLHLYYTYINLKPNNIFVDQSNNNPIRKWMITDFEISIFRNINNSENILKKRFYFIRKIRGKFTKTIKIVD
jgi:hypothetical protein